MIALSKLIKLYREDYLSFFCKIEYVIANILWKKGGYLSVV